MEFRGSLFRILRGSSEKVLYPHEEMIFIGLDGPHWAQLGASNAAIRGALCGGLMHNLQLGIQ